MNGAMEVACRLAYDTFKLSRNNKSGLLQRVLKLRERVAALKIEDVGIKESQIQSLLPQSHDEIDAPVGYVEIFEDDVLSVGAFLLKERAHLPLHNHPTMFGLLKVIHGRIRVKTFDLVEKSLNERMPNFVTHFPPQPDEVWKLRSNPETEFSADSGVIMTTPTEGNLHSMEAVGGPAVFVDFIAPPYNESLGRDCYYFKELSVREGEGAVDKDIAWARRIECPSSYYCVKLDYFGPDINMS